jgi:hypothetical protein
MQILRSGSPTRRSLEAVGPCFRTFVMLVPMLQTPPKLAGGLTYVHHATLYYR